MPRVKQEPVEFMDQDGGPSSLQAGQVVMDDHIMTNVSRSSSSYSSSLFLRRTMPSFRGQPN